MVDADLDGIPDLLVAERDEPRFQSWAGDGRGRFEQLPVTPVGGTPGALAVADVDGDGADDAFVLLPHEGVSECCAGRSATSSTSTRATRRTGRTANS